MYTAMVSVNRVRCIAAGTADRKGIARFSGHDPRLDRTVGGATRRKCTAAHNPPRAEKDVSTLGTGARNYALYGSFADWKER